MEAVVNNSLFEKVNKFKMKNVKMTKEAYFSIYTKDLPRSASLFCVFLVNKLNYNVLDKETDSLIRRGRELAPDLKAIVIPC